MLLLEVEGLYRTIQDYTTEKYIISYAEKLRLLQVPQDIKLIRIIVKRLLEWYESEISTIEKSHYIVNKKDHHKSIDILKKIQNEL